LTNADSIVRIRLDNDWKEVRTLKKGDLIQWIRTQTEFVEPCLLDEQGKPKKADDLRLMVRKWLENRFEAMQKNVDQFIEKNNISLPPTSQLIRTDAE